LGQCDRGEQKEDKKLFHVNWIIEGGCQCW
jgi:hypothetical protein